MFAANDLAGALEYLKRLLEQSDGSGELWLGSKIREIERTLKYNNYVDTYNLAVDLYNDEDYPEAVRVLEELLATLPEGAQADYVRAFLDDARREIAPR